jgi:hypothetical protein
MSSRYQRQFGNRANIHGASHNPHSTQNNNNNKALQNARRLAQQRVESAALDEQFGYVDFSWNAALTNSNGKVDPGKVRRRGWVFNVLGSTLPASAAGGDGELFVLWFV